MRLFGVSGKQINNGDRDAAKVKAAVEERRFSAAIGGSTSGASAPVVVFTRGQTPCCANRHWRLLLFYP
jgi:hypothetical protein